MRTPYTAGPAIDAYSANGHNASEAANEADTAVAHILGPSIGELIRELRGLTEQQVEQIIGHQRQHGVRFGEAAVALNLASSSDVLWALSRQFEYPYAPATGAELHPELVAAIDPFSDQAEAFRELRSQLLMGVLAPVQPHHALAVISPDVGDGKSFFAANMAITLSQLGGATLLIDADLRTPRQHELFGLGKPTGLSDLLCGRFEGEVIHHVAGLPSLCVLPAGTVPPNPLELMQRSGFGLLLKELLSRFEHVVVDTPAAVHGADARVLAARCGAALILGRRGKTRMKSLHTLVSAVEKSTPGLAGLVFNDR